MNARCGGQFVRVVVLKIVLKCCRVARVVAQFETARVVDACQCVAGHEHAYEWKKVVDMRGTMHGAFVQSAIALRTCHHVNGNGVVIAVRKRAIRSDAHFFYTYRLVAGFLSYFISW